MIDLGSLKSLSWLEITIFSKMSPDIDPAVNARKILESLKSVEMMSVECIMDVFDGFYSSELTYQPFSAVFNIFHVGNNSKTHSGNSRPVLPLRES